MADIKISGLPAAVFADLTDADVYESSIGGAVSHKVSLALIRQFVLTTGAVLMVGATPAVFGAAPYAEANTSAFFETRVKMFRAGNGASFQGYRANGSLAVPTAVLSGELCAVFTGGGFDGTAFGTAAALNLIAAQNWAVGAHGTRMQFTVTINGSAASTTRMTLTDRGHLAIGDMVISDATFGAGLVFGTVVGVEPTTVADRVFLFATDRSAGNRQLSVTQEAAVAAGVAVASTHKIPVRWNAVDYFLLASNV